MARTPPAYVIIHSHSARFPPRLVSSTPRPPPRPPTAPSSSSLSLALSPSPPQPAARRRPSPTRRLQPAEPSTPRSPSPCPPKTPCVRSVPRPTHALIPRPRLQIRRKLVIVGDGMYPMSLLRSPHNSRRLLARCLRENVPALFVRPRRISQGIRQFALLSLATCSLSLLLSPCAWLQQPSEYLASCSRPVRSCRGQLYSRTTSRRSG